MALIGKISVGLAAKTAKFQAGMKGARRSVKGFAATMQRAKAVAKGFGAAMTAAAAAAMVVMVKRSFKAIDATAKLAARINETTENLVGLQYAADITGAGAEKLSAAIDVLQKRLGEAAMGMGEGKKALETLNLSVDDLLKLRPAAQFKLIADRVSVLSNASLKAAVTSKLFSRANQDLVNMLDLGAKGIEKLMSKTVQLGMTYKGISAAKIEEANDALRDMDGAFQGLANQLAIHLAPTVATIGRELAGWAPSIAKAVKNAQDFNYQSSLTYVLMRAVVTRSPLSLGRIVLGRKQPHFLQDMGPRRMSDQEKKRKRMKELREKFLGGTISADEYLAKITARRPAGRVPKQPARAPRPRSEIPGRAQAAWISQTMAANRRQDTFLRIIQSAAMSEKASIEGRMPWPAGAGGQQRKIERTALGARVGGPSREQQVKDREAIAKLDELIRAIKELLGGVPAVAA